LQLSYAEFLTIFKPHKLIKAKDLFDNEEKDCLENIAQYFINNQKYSQNSIKGKRISPNIYLDSEIVYIEYHNPYIDLDYFRLKYKTKTSQIYVYNVGANQPEEHFLWNVFFKSFIVHELIHKMQHVYLGTLSQAYLKTNNNKDYYQCDLEKQAYFYQWLYIQQQNQLAKMKKYLYFRSDEEENFYNEIFYKIEGELSNKNNNLR